MRRETLFLLAGLAGIGAVYLWQQQSAGDPAANATDFSQDPLASVSDTVSSLLQGWKNTGSAQAWLPTLSQAETANALPPDLLARMAYQESHFREPIIRGTQASPAGALGILQLMPQYFQSVQVPTPFTDTDVTAQIAEAAAYLAKLYGQFGSWALAIAAYNAGPGNVQKYSGIPPFPETQSYVADVMADVPTLASGAAV